MKIKKRMFFVMSCFFMLIISTPCYAKKNNYLVDVNIVQKHSVSMVPNTKILIQAKGQNNISWKSTNTRVAQIKKYNSDTVIVSAKRPGTVTITASTGGGTYSCRVKVKKIKKAYFSFENKKDLDYDLLADKKMIVGETVYFNIMTKPKASFEERLSVKALKSSDSSVLSVKKTRGSIYLAAKKPGIATISAKIAKKTIKYTVTVEKPRISLSCADNITIRTGESLTVNIDSNINIIAVDQTGNSVSCSAEEEGNMHSITGKYQITLKGLRNGVSRLKIYQNSSAGTPFQKMLTVNVTDNPINDIKNIIQTSGYVNSDGEKFISYETEDNNSYTGFAIFDIFSDDRLLFYMYMETSGMQSSCNMIVSNQDVGVTPVIYVQRGDNDGFETEQSILKRNLVKNNNMSFKVNERYGVFTSSSLNSNIQSLSNAFLNSSLAGWDYLLAEQCNSSLYTMGFTLYR